MKAVGVGVPLLTSGVFTTLEMFRFTLKVGGRLTLELYARLDGAWVHCAREKARQYGQRS